MFISTGLKSSEMKALITLQDTHWPDKSNNFETKVWELYQWISQTKLFWYILQGLWKGRKCYSLLPSLKDDRMADSYRLTTVGYGPTSHLSASFATIILPNDGGVGVKTNKLLFKPRKNICLIYCIYREENGTKLCRIKHSDNKLSEFARTHLFSCQYRCSTVTMETPTHKGCL